MWQQLPCHVLTAGGAAAEPRRLHLILSWRPDTQRPLLCPLCPLCPAPEPPPVGPSALRASMNAASSVANSNVPPAGAAIRKIHRVSRSYSRSPHAESSEPDWSIRPSSMFISGHDWLSGDADPLGREGGSLSDERPVAMATGSPRVQTNVKYLSVPPPLFPSPLGRRPRPSIIY